MTFARLLLALLLATLGLAGPVQAQSFPPLSGRVVDAANLLDAGQKAQLTQLSEDVEKASGRQFVVATIPDLQDYPIEDYGYRLGRAWKIGQGEANNGIILIVAPKERKVRIEVGYGLEPIMTDALSSQIIQTVILPKFRDGDMPGGIVAGAQAIAEQMKLPLEAAEARAKAKLDSRRSSGANRGNNGAGLIVGIFWTVMVLVFVLGGIFGRRGGRRYRGGGSGLGQVLLWTAIDAAMHSGSRGGSSWGGGGSDWGGGGGGGGFSGGGGSFGGGGASGSW
ncbi:YgcG family protein [Sphingomonas sp.]|uniref:TPM domain-containing protein n=1 Tax=Sphingomonas sp. TaxID=28214 RepID=UPI001B284E86|nr:TPM domain-containing protein [Sphingomonas sp.]MBO9714207.1 TPM domain-containing protein [Sphingomonas sp.]